MRGKDALKRRIVLVEGKVAAEERALDAMRSLTEMEVTKVAGGKITGVKTNGGGNTPNGTANGVPTVNYNPAGSTPPGQNK